MRELALAKSQKFMAAAGRHVKWMGKLENQQRWQCATPRQLLMIGVNLYLYTHSEAEQHSGNFIYSVRAGLKLVMSTPRMYLLPHV